MGLFSRKGSKDQQAGPQEVERIDEPSTEADAESAGGAAVDTASSPARAAVDRSSGPFDRSEVDDELAGRLDFGSIAIVPVPGMELRLDVSDDGQEITGLTAILDQAACQLQAFAAPKSSGIWDDIREEIHDNIVAAGGTAQEVDGPLGIELHVRMPAQGPDGRPSFSPARFVGVDGPRWFLRGVLTGSAATDDATATGMTEFLRQSVVVRGGEPRAPREMLPLRVPEGSQAISDDADTVEEQAATQDDFTPFERGPEITEVR